MNELIAFLVQWSRPFPSRAPIRLRYWYMEMREDRMLMLRLESRRVGGKRLAITKMIPEEGIVTAYIDVVLETAMQAARELEAGENE